MTSHTRIQGIHSPRLRNFIAFQRDPLQFLVDVLPEGDIVSLRTSAFRPTFIVNAPDFVQEILVAKDGWFRKGRSSAVLRRTVGDGLLTTENPVHQQQKKTMTPAFYKERIRAYCDIVAEEARKTAASLREGEPVAMHELMMKLTLGIIARSMFATDVEDRKAELADAVDVTIRQSARTLFSPIVLPFGVPTRGNRQHRGAIRTLEEMVYGVIRDARAHPGRYADTLLGLLLDARREDGRPLPDAEIRDQLMTMLLAGHETTANALVWVWESLARVPEAEAAFHAELDRIDESRTVEGQDDAESPYDRYRRLPYTQQVVQETLRLYPPAWIILREAKREVELLGERFPADSSFLISPYALHRNERVFGDALSFRPERFAGEQAGWPKFAYFPFGGGSRGCIGSQFAILEAVLILAELGSRFRFLRTDETPAVPEPLVSLRVKGSLTMVPVRRERESGLP
ncbi:cytochrome P450 [Paenibacillus sp. J31TS4]|uniref:cytochrome P450 n=1 Tax=Paenibacillus sp. J31TS4 TaxID=2807195 RepID=UPI001B0593F9|nr:cytochrome P450 [Paenibacillus sp. J31TS4]GIP39430.1 cytochrome P450 [Paenibacillus sp. J31TS4]